MNRKIMLLPLTAALVFGLASCDDPNDSGSVNTNYDGYISTIEVGDVAVSGLVAQKGTKGWILDDGKASVYVYGALGDTYNVGDHVNVQGKCVGYWGLYEITGATVTKNANPGPTLSDPVEIDGTILQSTWDVLTSSGQDDAKWSPTNSKRYKITGLTAESVSSYAGWAISGFSNKIVPYYYDAAYNVTEANRNNKLYAGCKYDVSFYLVGTNSAKNINMGIFDVTAYFDSVTSVTITGDSSVGVGSSVTLTGACLPATANQGLTWTSSNEAVATVSSYGKVTGVSIGSTTITATSTADTSKKYEFAMSVVQGSSYSKVASLSFNKDTTVTIDNQLSATTDPYISYTSTEGVKIEVRKGTSTTGVNEWKTSYASCRWYAYNNVVISHANDFDRVVLTCDGPSDGKTYSDLGNVTLPTGASYDTVNDVITITLASKVKSLTLDLVKQIRPNNVELQVSK